MAAYSFSCQTDIIVVSLKLVPSFYLLIKDAELFTYAIWATLQSIWLESHIIRCVMFEGMVPGHIDIWGLWFHKYVSRARESNYILWNLWDLNITSLQWRHNGRDSVSNHQHHECLVDGLFRRRSKKTWKLRVTGLCAVNSPVTGECTTQMASNAENVSIWWRHHVFSRYRLLTPKPSAESIVSRSSPR